VVEREPTVHSTGCSCASAERRVSIHRPLGEQRARQHRADSDRATQRLVQDPEHQRRTTIKLGLARSELRASAGRWLVGVLLRRTRWRIARSILRALLVPFVSEGRSYRPRARRRSASVDCRAIGGLLKPARVSGSDALLARGGCGARRVAFAGRAFDECEGGMGTVARVGRSRSRQLDRLFVQLSEWWRPIAWSRLTPALVPVRHSPHRPKRRLARTRAHKRHALSS
jgi:hypothetical protein